MKKATKQQILTIVLLLIFIGSSFTYAITILFEPQNVEWSASLYIVIFNEPVEIPSEIGVTGESKAKLYTLQADNKIYKNTQEDVKLGEFFEIWGKTFNRTCILDYCNVGNNSMKMYVNNQENSDYELYTIKNNDVIKIDYR
jgi:hypothetical protein